MEKQMLNMVEIMKSVGYAETGVAGQKTRLAKAHLGLGDEAKDVFMFDKEEVLTMLNAVAKSKSEKAIAAGQIFDKIGKGELEDAWVTEFVKAESAGSTATKSKSGAAGRKGTNEDRKGFIADKGLDEEFRAWMVAKYGA